MTIPDSIRFWRVDEVIECLPLSHPLSWTTPEGKAQSQKVQAALLEAMPDAYKTSAHGTPEEREVPEPDGTPDRQISLIWDKLPEDIQAIIVAAANHEFP